jgi:hypothetical protein
MISYNWDYQNLMKTGITLMFCHIKEFLGHLSIVLHVAGNG